MSTTEDEQCWPQSFPDFKELDSLLRCGICYDYVSTALMTPCSHNFCSLCIRKYMLYKTTCPTCFVETVESQLRYNRTLDNIVLVTLRLKEPLCNALKGNIPHNDTKSKHKVLSPSSSPSTSSHNTSLLEKSCVTPALLGGCERATPVTPTLCSSEAAGASSSPSLVPDMCHQPQQESSPRKAPVAQNTSSPLKPAPRSVMQMLMMSPLKKASPSVPSSPRHSTQSSAPAVIKVPCPVCNVDIPERNINIHLDKCLKNQNKPPVQNKSEKTDNGRRPLPKLVYHVLADRELKKKLAEVKLSTQGDRKTLERRHQKYTLLYNSECDKKNPRSVWEIVKQVEREEKEESRSSSKTQMALQVDRKADPKVIEDAQKKYLKENKSSFDALLADLKRRQEVKKNKSAAFAAGPSTSSTVTRRSPSPVNDHPPSDDHLHKLGESVYMLRTTPKNKPAVSPKLAKELDELMSGVCGPSSGEKPAVAVKEHDANPPGKKLAKNAMKEYDELITNALSPQDTPVSRQKAVASPSLLDDCDLDTTQPDISDVSNQENKSPEVNNTHDISPTLINASPPGQSESYVKSPILGKRRLFENYENKNIKKKSTVIIISDEEDGDSDCTVFSEGDFAAIDALTELSQEMETPPEEVVAPPGVRGPSCSNDDSNDSADMFQAPRTRNTKQVSVEPLPVRQTRKRVANKRQSVEEINQEPRRSTRKKAKC